MSSARPRSEARRRLAVLASASLLTLYLGACVSPTAPTVADSPWVTAEEAKLPEAGAVRRAEPDDGPRILLVKPKNHETTPSPIDVDIRFEPRAPGDVFLESLKVEYLKLFTIDITDRIRPYATPEGIRGEDVPFPEGKHRIRVSLEDSLGRLTAIVFEIRVVES